MTTPKREKIYYLESLRGIAAISVALFHFRVGSSFENAFTGNAWLMVDFFFVLSGFVIALNYQSTIKNWKDIYVFQARRFLRLYPLHIVMLFVSLGVETMKYIAEIRFGLVANHPAFDINNLGNFVHNLFLIHNLVNDDLTWNGVSWSISAEFYTYFVFAVLSLTTFFKKWIYLGCSILIVILTGYFLYTTNSMDETKTGFIRCLYSFFLGVIACNITKQFLPRLPNWISYIAIAFAIFLVSIAEIRIVEPYNFLIPISFALVLLSLTMSSGTNYLKSMLNHKILIYLGTISYGVYMIHTTIWWVISQILIIGFDMPTYVDSLERVVIQTDSLLLSNLVVLLGLTIIIGLAHLSYKFIEMPANKFRYKIK